VRITHLKAASDVAGDAKHVHGNMYQLLSWTNGSFAKARIDALEQQIKRATSPSASSWRRCAARPRAPSAAC
jgi:hypothetical protein